MPFLDGDEEVLDGGRDARTFRTRPGKLAFALAAPFVGNVEHTDEQLPQLVTLEDLLFDRIEHGMVAHPMSLSIAQIRVAPRRTQITRHDCVEGWSAIGQWTSLPLGMLLRQAGLSANARFIVFHCADDTDGTPYYESLDLIDAMHPQTILAGGMNGQTLSVGHGAPLRLRAERQLGYKQAKYVSRVEAVPTLAGIGQGKGGYWEDVAEYQWYAGI